MAADPPSEQGQVQSRDGTRLFWRAWRGRAPKPVVTVAHGLGEHSGRYGRLAAALNTEGFGCWAVDLRGMGQSDGRRGHVDRWQQWVEDLVAFHDLVQRESDGLEVVPLGHSFGGVLLASAVLTGALRPARFVLSNPAFRPAIAVPGWKLVLGRVTSGVLPRLTMGNEVDPALLSRDPAVAAEYAADPLVHDRISSRLFTEWVAASRTVLERAPELATPVLVIVSEADRIIDPEGAVEFARRAEWVAIVQRYPDRSHEPFNDLDADQVFADLTAWLDGRSAR